MAELLLCPLMGLLGQLLLFLIIFLDPSLGRNIVILFIVLIQVHMGRAGVHMADRPFNRLCIFLLLLRLRLFVLLRSKSGALFKRLAVDLERRLRRLLRAIGLRLALLFLPQLLLGLLLRLFRSRLRLRSRPRLYG